MAMTPRPILRLKFAQAATPPQATDGAPAAIKRPSRETKANDPAMRDYMVNLESRLIHHVQRHARQWIDREAGKILRKWNAPILQPPAPRGAPPRDFVRDARRYAEELVMGRVEGRLKQFHAIRQVRGFVHDPLGDRLRAAHLPDGPKPTHKHR